MKGRHYNIVLYVVAMAIAITVGVQFYWNYISYQANKQELQNQVQESLDQALETYYTHVARNNNITIIADSDSLPRYSPK